MQIVLTERPRRFRTPFSRARRTYGSLVGMACALVLGLATALPAEAQQSIPFSGLPLFASTSDEATWVLDLETLPARPVLIVEAFPPETRPDMQIEIELSNFSIDGGPGACPDSNTVLLSTPDIGPNSLSWSSIPCDPRTEALDGHTVELTVRVVHFGSNGPGGKVSVDVYGVTRVPTGLDEGVYLPTLDPSTVYLDAAKDTTLYEASPSGSNGLGDYLWVGTDISFTQGNSTTQEELRSLIAFDVHGPVPETAIVDSVELELDFVDTQFGGTVELFRMGSDLIGSPAMTWVEGIADAPGDEFTAGPLTDKAAATWNHRIDFPAVPWSVPGGDPTGAPLDSVIATTGVRTFSSSALTAAVQDMVANEDDEDGFVLSSPDDWFFATGIQIKSRNGFVSGTSWPKMIVTYTPTVPQVLSEADAGVVRFVGEGEDFRFAYDNDDNGVFESSVGGIFSVVDPSAPGYLVPYRYQFTGDPGFVGHDCALWLISAPESGTTGVGMAIWAHNTTASLPDSDGDGIFDICDNCVNVPNGPSVGTCVAGAAAGALCNADWECPGSTCSLSQEDADRNFEGDVCVPEPSFGVLIQMGVLVLLGARASRRVGVC